MKIIFALALAYVTAACGENSALSAAKTDNGGTLVIAMPSDPGAIFPPFAFSTSARLIASQIYDYLADVGPQMNTIGDAGFRAQLAERWTWSRDSLSITFHLNPRARWHDGRRVTSRDVTFTHALYRNPDLGGQTIEEHARIDSVTARDSLTVVFWFATRSPVQFLDAAAQVQILPAHVIENLPVKSLRASPPPLIGSGRFKMKRWDKRVSGELVADSGNYRGRAKLDRVIWTISGSLGAVTRLLNGSADLFEPMRPEDVAQVARNENLRVVTLQGLDYVFMSFNLRDPAQGSRPHSLFGDRELRRSIAMLVDRAQVVRNILDTLALVAVGPTVRAYPTTDPLVAQLPFDTARAARTLDSLGWSRPAAGAVRSRNGRPLAFTVIVPSSSRSRVRAAVLIQEQLRRAGVRMDIESMDNPAFMARWADKKFDAAFGTWNMGATPGITLQLWGRPGHSRGGLKFGSYWNPACDAAVDSALTTNDPRLARAFFTNAYRIINEDAPAVWLYELNTVIGVHRRVRGSEMRTGAWWFDLAGWWIPRAERLPRDQI